MPGPRSSTERAGRVLVTGLDGFTGQFLGPELARRGYSVLPFAHDLRDLNATRRAIEVAVPEFVVHLAGISFVGHGSATEVYAVNTVGTCNLLSALAESALPVRKVVVASSSQIYGNAEAERIRETDEAAPVSHYGCSKLAMERMARNFAERLPIVIARPFNYTGAGQSEQFLVPKIVGHFARRAKTIELGNLDVVRDFSDVRTVVDVYCRLLEQPVEGETLNICSGSGHSLRWILEKCEEITQFCPDVVVRSEFIRASDVRRLVGSNDRLVEAIGPLKSIDLGTTLTWMLGTAAAAPGTA